MRQALTGLVALASGLALTSPVFAATFSRPAFTLAYDAGLWRERPAVPPTLAALDCIAAPCAGTAVQILADPRPLPRPGVSRFTPGALGFAAAALRTPAPARRLVLDAPSTPMRLDGVPAARSRFTVVAPDLSRSTLVDVLLPSPPGTLHILLAAPALSSPALAAFDRLLAGFRLRDR